MRNETDSIPDIFLDVLTPASRIHNHNTRFVSNLNYFRPRVSTSLGKTSFKFSARKIWETVPPGRKCLPYHKFKKEWMSYHLTNQIWPCLYVLSLILFEIFFLSLLLPIIWTWRCPTRKLLLLWTQMDLMSFSQLLFISYFIFLPTYTCLNILYSVK